MTVTTQQLRQVWIRIHRYFALSFGWILALMGLTGALLVIAPPIDAWLHPELFKVAATQPAQAAALEPLRERLAAEFGPKASFGFRLPREESESLRVTVRSAWTGTVYVDPSTGRELGRRAEDQGFVNVLFKLHSSLWLKDTGKAILACVALMYLFLLISGVTLWSFGSAQTRWRVETRKGLTRGLFDLHRLGGVTIGFWIAISVATGAYMAWRPLGGFVTMLAGEKPVVAPKLMPHREGDGKQGHARSAVQSATKAGKSDIATHVDARSDVGVSHVVTTNAALSNPVASNVTAFNAAASSATLDTWVATVHALLPDAMIGLVQVDPRADRPVRVRVKLRDDPHPNGLTSVWLDPATSKVISVQRWNALDPGARAVSYVYPLHTGELGGPLLEAVIALGGTSLGALGISGIWLWWRRRRARRASRMSPQGA